jgi:predicted nucleic acid-binding protein
MLIYCDTVILIYFHEHTGPFNVRAVNRLTALRAAGDRMGVSDLSRLECRVRPIRLGDAAAVAMYDSFFALPEVQLLPIASATFDRATLFRANYNFKLADALHLAAAIDGGCDRFLTNDARLSRCTDIPVEVLP